MTNKELTNKQYRLLFNTVSDTIQNLEQMRDKLKSIQAAAEELCIGEGPSREPILFTPQPQAMRAVE